MLFTTLYFHLKLSWRLNGYPVGTDDGSVSSACADWPMPSGKASSLLLEVCELWMRNTDHD